MSNEARAALSVSAVSIKRSKIMGGMAISLGLFFAVVALVNVLAGFRDVADILMFAAGVLASIAGLRLFRKVRAG